MTTQKAKLFLITPDGSETRTCAGPKASLSELQAAVGGLIEAVRVRFQGKVYTGYVNEEGLLHDLPINRVATAMQARAYGSPFVGNLVIEGRPGTALNPKEG